MLLTGPLGASAAGLRLLAAGDALDVPEHVAEAHRRPVARLREGVVARGAGVRAAIDVSDGLAADAVHLARASGVGLELALGPEAVAAGAEPSEALSGGEDYELVLATSEPDRLRADFRAAGLRPPIDIGVCTGRAGEWQLDGRPMPAVGWRHRF